jgi:hypothetical protein
MAKAYESGAYTLAQIAGHFGVHYSTVSRAVKQPEWDTPVRGVLLQGLTPLCFATEGWLYLRMRGIRLRGRVTLSSVAIDS